VVPDGPAQEAPGGVVPGGALGLERALTLAYAYLNRRERTERELREHLLRRDVEPTVADQALAQLRDEGYLDDRRFARLLIQDRASLDGWGGDRIRDALLARGVPAELAEAALVQEGDRADELERALNLLERRFPAGFAGRRDSERALGVLLRKGYEYELASDALSEHRRRAAGPDDAQPC
jgi:regulatory protein